MNRATADPTISSATAMSVFLKIDLSCKYFETSFIAIKIRM